MAVIHETEPVVHHTGGTTGDNGLSFIMGIILLLAFAFLLFYYLLPAMRGAFSTPQVNVPGRIDVNVNR